METLKKKIIDMVMAMSDAEAEELWNTLKEEPFVQEIIDEIEDEHKCDKSAKK